MSVILRIIILSFLFILSPLIYAHGGSHLGKINFPTSGSSAAQVYFERGIMQLHSFEYDEARSEFQKAEDIDPDFGMAYWGEAMTYNHPIWGEQDVDAGNLALSKYAKTAQERITKIQTPKEKAYMHAVNILFESSDKKSRDLAYVDAMRELYRQYPDDDEIASFYALALLGVTETERDFRLYMQAAGIAEDIYSRNPYHPGALHYALHSYDDPIHAPLGLRAARAYAKIAPDAAHALHMPSHIFLAMGMWDDVIASNKAAWESGLKQNVSKSSNKFTIDDLHALQWLSYGYLQKKDYKLAFDTTKIMEKIAIESNAPMAKWYYSVMRAAYISASSDFSANLKKIDLTGIELSALANDAYVNALIELHGDKKLRVKTVKNIIDDLQKSITSVTNKTVGFKDFFTAITPSGVINTKIIILELQAKLKILEGNKVEALRILKKAASLEQTTAFGYGPPLPVKPSIEMYSDLLLDMKKYQQAYLSYSDSLKRMPNRIESVNGSLLAESKLREHNEVIPDGIQPYFNRLMLPDYYH